MTNNQEKKDLTDHDKSGNVDMIWQHLKDKAAAIRFGVIDCQLTVHDGQIRQLDITQTKERFRVD